MISWSRDEGLMLLRSSCVDPMVISSTSCVSTGVTSSIDESLVSGREFYTKRKGL